jgi:esterase/lipase superfamily enzyme
VPLEQTTLSLVLAAPDISTKEFNETLRPSLVQQQQMHIVVYCSADRALVVSRLYNQSDVRLGYCMPDPDASSNQNPRGAGPNHNSHEMPGVDLVTVRGEVRDFAHHSYYLSAVEILDDLQAIFGGGALDKIRAHSDGMMRTIQVR